MRAQRFLAAGLLAVVFPGLAWAELPVASYIFPAGGQRGKTVDVRVGGLFLHRRCSFEMLGPGVEVSRELLRTHTFWLEGPLLPLPDSQQAEAYPKDMAGKVHIRPDAAPGIRYWRLLTSQGATPAMKFMVGDLPEVVEDEIDGDPVPTLVTLPVTINGRIFPREDVDVWTFAATRGQTVLCEVHAARLGSPLQAHLEIRGPLGRRISESDSSAPDPALRFTAPVDGKYQVRIHDIRMKGGQSYVYRLTLTSGPHVDFAYPLGGRRGRTVPFELSGQGLPNGPGPITLPPAGSRDYLHRLDVAGQLTNGFLLERDDLEEFLEAEPNDDPAQVKPLPVPAVFNGRIQQPGDVDHWAWKAKKGEVFELDLRAARLGSPLDGVLTLQGAAGKELARAESPGPAQPDPVLRFQAPADGTYTVRVQDRFRSRGGRAFAYRLRIDHPAGPDFHLRLEKDAVTVPRGGQGTFKVLAERQGSFTAPITLAVEGLPRGVTATPLTIAAGQNAVNLTFKAEAASAIGAARLTIRGTASPAGQSRTRTAEALVPRGLPVLNTVLLAVALPTPFKIKGEYDMRWAARGTVHQRRYRIERGGYEGPIEVSLTDNQARHLQGVTGPTVVVPPGVSEFTYAVQLPPWMETGRTCRVCVMGVGKIKDADGREHEVSFSSIAQNEQLVAVIEPDPLGVETAVPTLVAAAGKSTSLPVRVVRGKGLQGEVKVELLVPAHIHGVRADPVMVPANQERGQLAIHFGTRPGPFNMPLTIRATLPAAAGPIIAETKVEILPER
jgi:hypothetical protein